jgi:ubiquinone biosynthesis protein Coq4
MHLAKLLQAFRAFREGAPLGDVVMLKLDALSRPSETLIAKLERFRDPPATPDLPALRRLPAGTLGREYARFLDANGIDPLAVSIRVRANFHDDPYLVRYTTTHDLHHVLTGFDAGLAGEIGVAAFTVAQGSAPVGRWGLAAAHAVYSLVSPSQARRIAINARAGLAMGRAADLVLAEPIEAWLDEPLEAVRRRLRIPDPRDAGVVPSGESVVARLLYPARMAGG